VATVNDRSSTSRYRGNSRLVMAVTAALAIVGNKLDLQQLDYARFDTEAQWGQAAKLGLAKLMLCGEAQQQVS
jgi:hypothetical protein